MRRARDEVRGRCGGDQSRAARRRRAGDAGAPRRAAAGRAPPGRLGTRRHGVRLPGLAAGAGARGGGGGPAAAGRGGAARAGRHLRRLAVRVGRPDETGHRLLAGSSTSHFGSRAASSRAMPGSRRRSGIPVPVEGERSGDLATYGAGDRADHVAFWLEGGRILHATARGGLGVVEEVEPAELHSTPPRHLPARIRRRG